MYPPIKIIPYILPTLLAYNWQGSRLPCSVILLPTASLFNDKTVKNYICLIPMIC